MSPLKGQKLTEKPKDKLLQVRIDKETVEKLDSVANALHLNRSEVVRKGIEEQYERLENKK